MSGLQRSFAFSIVDKASSVVMSIMTMAIISRLLAPDQVGLFMIGSSIVILIEACRDFEQVVVGGREQAVLDLGQRRGGHAARLGGLLQRPAPLLAQGPQSQRQRAFPFVLHRLFSLVIRAPAVLVASRAPGTTNM